MSKTNIKMDKPSYIIKENDGIVVCKINCYGNDSCFDTLFFNDYNIRQKLKKKFNMVSASTGLQFTAVAKLHKGDEWNETIGKRIAESKCKRNIYHFYYRLYSFLIEETTNDLSRLGRYVSNLAYCKVRENDHLKELMNNQ